jgi:hypothetical protein
MGILKEKLKNRHIIWNRLSTLHRQQEYKSKGDGHVTKFFPRYDSPYTVIDAHPKTSNYTLELPNLPNIFPTFHSSELKPHFANDHSLFPLHEMAKPQPVITRWNRHSVDPFMTCDIDHILVSVRPSVTHDYQIDWNCTVFLVPKRDQISISLTCYCQIWYQPGKHQIHLFNCALLICVKNRTAYGFLLLYDFNLFSSHASQVTLPKPKCGQCHGSWRGLPNAYFVTDV